MHDEKRMLRELKRSIKRSGNRKRRRFLKNVDVDHEQFNYGSDSSSFMNEKRLERDENLDD